MMIKKKIKKEKVQGDSKPYRQSARSKYHVGMSKGVLGLIIDDQYVGRECLTQKEVDGDYYAIFFGGKTCARCKKAIGEGPTHR